jgi:hypothetical protein
MTDRTPELPGFPAVCRRKVEADFGGGSITSDGGGNLLLPLVDRSLRLTERLAEAIPDPRLQSQVTHPQLRLTRQRVFGIANGWEDLNDHDELRYDLAFQTAVGGDEALGSSPTLSRFENNADARAAWEIHKIFVDTFIAQFPRAPEEIVLDLDATDDAVHGHQVGRQFHGYYDHYCFLPLYIFCGDHLLVAYLRRSRIDAAKHSLGIIRLLVGYLRQHWPRTCIILRGDSGFCRWKLMRYCDNQSIGYIFGLAKNERLKRLLAPTMASARSHYEHTGSKVREFTALTYAADTWDRQRRVIGKGEYGDRGANPRFIVTNLPGDPEQLYTQTYCARGDMENRIKEQQLDLFADRTSCHNWWPNQLRVLLAGAAYILISALRRMVLVGTGLAKATCGTIRLKLFKIGAVVTRNTRRVRLHLSEAYPLKQLFSLICRRLTALQQE